ncbi:MAG: hypothetical protein IPI41_07430 [Flavobacteriales bacterium]|nr:hypothetical protein [Flavobacteriales bacterium]
MKNTPATTLSTFDGTGLVTVHEVPPTSLGLVAGEPPGFILSSHFAGTVSRPYWWPSPHPGPLEDVPAVLSASAGMALQARPGWISPVGDDFIALNATPMDSLGTAITSDLLGEGDTSPAVNSTIFEAVDAQDRRILNVHLPWSDGRVYWDAGNDGGGFDRIDKATTPAEAEGQWNHWAFMKNTATGQMKIYLNGVLWHSGTGKTKPLSGIASSASPAAATGISPIKGSWTR